MHTLALYRSQHCSSAESNIAWQSQNCKPASDSVCSSSSSCCLLAVHWCVSVTIQSINGPPSRVQCKAIAVIYLRGTPAHVSTHTGNYALLR
eukprot:2912-Heterococcus_DN1.PRE.3